MIQKTNIDLEDLKSYLGFGIAGNFAHHLDQAGEASDFVNVEVKEAHAPKGIFPFYLPNKNDSFLSTFALSSEFIIHPRAKDGNLQLEPEVGLICDIVYQNNQVIKIEPRYFGAYNDATIRKDGASKISQKKNWGKNTKGISTQLIELDGFDKNSIIDSFHIASFVMRDNMLHEYGNDSPVNTYNYIYSQLLNWIVEKLNTQKDINPLEDLHSYIDELNYPDKMIISIGATSYTDWGENNYLEVGDEIFVIIYDKNIYSNGDIKEYIKNNIENSDEELSLKNCSILHQKII
jgi:hypothetical protein